jgi:hypothetical protein
MQCSRVGSCLLVEDLAGWAFFDGLDAIFEDRGPKVAGTKVFLGCGHPGEVTTTSAKVTIVQNAFSLFMNYTSPKNGVNTTEVQSVVEDEVTARVVTDASTLFSRDVGLKTLGLKVKENVSIPRVRGVDEEERLIRKRVSRFIVFIGTWESIDELGKHQGFFGLSLGKIKIEFLKNNDPL